MKKSMSGVVEFSCAAAKRAVRARVLSAPPPQSGSGVRYALIAVHRSGVISFAEAVPLCTVVVLPALTVVPMLSLFWYCHDDVSFWNFLFLDPELAGTEDLEVLAQLSDAI